MSVRKEIFQPRYRSAARSDCDHGVPGEETAVAPGEDGRALVGDAGDEDALLKGDVPQRFPAVPGVLPC